MWNRIAPGLASKFDSPYSIPVIAPRPLYILNGEHNQYLCMLIIYQHTYKFSRISCAGAKDPRCPLGGLVVALKKAEKAYKETASPGNFKVNN